MRRKDREVTSEAWIRKVLEEAEILHLALIDPAGKPYSVPVHYGLSDNCLYIHGAMQGRTAETMRAHPDVAFHVVVGYELVPSPVKAGYKWGIYRSVMGEGRVRVVTDLDEKRRAIDLLHAHYGDVRENYSVADAKLEKVVNVLAVEITSLTGKTKGYPNPDNPQAVIVRKE